VSRSLVYILISMLFYLRYPYQTHGPQWVKDLGVEFNLVRLGQDGEDPDPASEMHHFDARGLSPTTLFR
jgi:hypothetical protein